MKTAAYCSDCHFIGIVPFHTPANTHPADILTSSARREGLRANDGAATHEGRRVTPATPPLFGPDSHRLWEQALRHGGLFHLQQQSNSP